MLKIFAMQNIVNHLHRHLEYIHGLKRKKHSEINNDEPKPSSSKRQTTILQHVKGLDFEETVSKLAALDGILINTITKILQKPIQNDALFIDNYYYTHYY